MPLIPFGEWCPDIADIGTDTLDVARNVYPGVNSYLPALDLLAQSVDALPLPCKGLWFVQKTDGGYDTYAATRTKIYRYNSDTFGFDNVSRASAIDYSLPSDDFWSGAQFGNRLIVTQLGDPVQFIDIDTGTHFEALPGSPSLARFVTVMDDKVVLSCLVDNPREIQWSGVNDSEEWNSGLAGNQEFVDHGAVMGFFPHARIVLLERGMRTIVSTGDIYSFNFPEMTNEKGTTAPWSCIEFGSRLYFLSVDGLYVVNSNMEPTSISDNRVGRYLFSNLNNERHFQVFGTFDPYNPRLLWTYPTGDTEYNDRVLVFDYSMPSEIGPFGRFTELSINTYILARLATSAVTLEGGSDSTDLDAAGLPSLDSRLYMAGAPVLIAVGTDLKLSTLAGASLQATLETGTYQLGDGRRTRVRAVMPMVEGDDADQVTVKVSKRKRLSEPWSISSAIPQQASGWCRMNADGFFHKFEFTIAGGISWDHAQGWMPDYVSTGMR